MQGELLYEGTCVAEEIRRGQVEESCKGGMWGTRKIQKLTGMEGLRLEAGVFTTEGTEERGKGGSIRV
jgi:hypothetical protein